MPLDNIAIIQTNAGGTFGYKFSPTIEAYWELPLWQLIFQSSWSLLRISKSPTLVSALLLYQS